MYGISLLFIFLLLFSHQAFSQTPGHMVGFYTTFANPDKRGVADVDQSNGNAIPLDTLVGYHGSTSGGTAFDPYRNLFYIITSDSINLYLISINITTGQVSTLYQVDSIGDGTPGASLSCTCFSWISFNYVDSTIYFLEQRTIYDPTQYLRKINPVTKEVTDLFALSPLWKTAGMPYLDCKHQKIFFLRYDFNALQYLIGTYDLEDGSFYSVPLSEKTETSVFYYFALNPNDNFLYGYEQDYDDPSTFFALRVVRVDPVTGSIVHLTPVCELNAWEAIMDPVSNKNYFFGLVPNSGRPDLYCFDIASQTLTSMLIGSIDNSPVSLVIGLQLYPVFDQQPASNFTFDNVCQSFPTTFSPDVNQGSFGWSFGDPASGSANESFLANPEHIYSEAGTYDVTMISSTCYKSDTMTRQVTIEPFPHIGLGTDTFFCSNQPQTPLQLDVTVPGYEYVWQDQSTLPTFTVTQPGVYWVNISGSCGSVSDTLKVLSQICDCGITLLPNLTAHTANIHLECDLVTYHHLHLELFDMLGRKVMDKSVTENDFEIDINRVSSGVFSYRFRDDNHTIQTGKIVVIH